MIERNKISAIIPCYNSQDTIIQSLNSVLYELREYKCEWEVVVVDDGSIDDSQQIISNFVSKLPVGEKIKLIYQGNKGVAAARNAGIKASTGEYIAFNDSDDYWLPGRLEILMHYLKNNGDVVLLGGVFGSDNIQTIRKLQYDSVITIKDQVFKNYFAPPATIIRREILNKSGLFNETMKHAEDGYFFNNIVFNGKAVLLKDRVSAPITTKNRYGDSGLSGDLLKMEKGELHNIKQAYKDKYISCGIFILAYVFSILKFIRRVIISKIRTVK